MSAPEQVLIPVALLGNGIAAGVMFSTVIGIVPLTLALPYDRYVQTIQFLWKRYDPFMPVVNVATFALDIAAASVTDDGPARACCLAAAVALGAVMAISLLKNVPINRYVMSLDPHDRPTEWARLDPRLRWRNWNLVRTSLALLALAANLVAAAALI